MQRSTLQVPEEGGPSHCGLETKAFPRCPAARTHRPSSRPPRRARCGPRSHCTRCRAVRSSRAVLRPRLSAPRRPSHNATPSLRPRGGQTPADPKGRPPLLLPRPPGLPTHIPKGSTQSLQPPPPPAPGCGPAAGLQGGVGQVSSLRAAPAPTTRLDAPGLGASHHPIPHPFPDAPSPSAAAAASSASGGREASGPATSRDTLLPGAPLWLRSGRAGGEVAARRAERLNFPRPTPSPAMGERGRRGSW